MKEPNLVWGNHKIKNYIRYTKDKENGIKTYHYRESRKKRSRDEDRNKETTKQPENNEQNDNNMFIPISKR